MGTVVSAIGWGVVMRGKFRLHNVEAAIRRIKEPSQ